MTLLIVLLIVSAVLCVLVVTTDIGASVAVMIGLPVAAGLLMVTWDMFGEWVGGLG